MDLSDDEEGDSDFDSEDEDEEGGTRLGRRESGDAGQRCGALCRPSAGCMRGCLGVHQPAEKSGRAPWRACSVAHSVPQRRPYPLPSP